MTARWPRVADADTLDLTGRALAMRGDLKGAQADFSKAASLAPRDVQILNRLAAAELSLGDTRSAEAELTRSLAIAPNQRLAGEAIVQAALARGDVAAATRDVEQLRTRVGDAEEVGVLGRPGAHCRAGHGRRRDAAARRAAPLPGQPRRHAQPSCASTACAARRHRPCICSRTCCTVIPTTSAR